MTKSINIVTIDEEGRDRMEESKKSIDNIRVGIFAEYTFPVTETVTAISMGSGTVPVCATPAVIAGAEAAAVSVLAPFLGENETTVGTYIDLAHLAATPLGMNVISKAKLIDADGRKFTFTIECRDAHGIIAKGKHERFLVQSDTFLQNAEKRKK